MANLFTTNQATFEGTPHLWGSGFAFTYALSSAQAAEGTQSLAVTSNSTSAINPWSGDYTTAGLPGMVPVTVGQVYSGMVSGRAATAAVSFDLRLQFFSGTAASLTFISQFFSSAGTETTTGWVQVDASGTAPAGATYAMLDISFGTAASGLTHYLDKAGILEGSTTTWVAPPNATPLITYNYAVQIG